MDCVVELGGNRYCADCKREQVKDIQSGADTTALDLASIGRRWTALMIDGLIFTVPVVVIVVFLILGSFGEGSDPGGAPASQSYFQIIVQVFFGAALAIYEGIMLSARGQTLGKMAMKIKVVTPEGNDISAGQAWGRSVLRAFFGLLSWIGFVNYIAALFGKEKKCLHDSIAKTRVINLRT